MKLMSEDDLPDGDFRVFMALLADLQWDNFIAVNVSGVALRIGRSRQSVSGALRRLVEHGYLIRGPRIGRGYTYTLAPHVGWKGTDAGYNQLQRKMRERGMTVVEGGAEETPGQTSIEL